MRYSNRLDTELGCAARTKPSPDLRKTPAVGFERKDIASSICSLENLAPSPTKIQYTASWFKPAELSLRLWCVSNALSTAFRAFRRSQRSWIRGFSCGSMRPGLDKISFRSSSPTPKKASWRKRSCRTFVDKRPMLWVSANCCVLPPAKPGATTMANPPHSVLGVAQAAGSYTSSLRCLFDKFWHQRRT